ncbi:Small ribosomal subunit protein uS17-like protein [Drosera capensis]
MGYVTEKAFLKKPKVFLRGELRLSDYDDECWIFEFGVCLIDWELMFWCVMCVCICVRVWICSSKKTVKGKRPGKEGNRFWKNIGLGFKTPREAIEGNKGSRKES